MKKPNHHHQILNIVPGNKTETVCSMQLINAVSKKQSRNKPHIFAIETLETVDLDEDKLRAFTLTLDTDNLGQLKLYSIGASYVHRCEHARQHFQMFIRKSRSKFSVRTANGDIQLREYIYATVTVNNRRYRAKWYLLPKSPFKYICSRKLFFRMGYSITPPGQYRNKPVAENLDTTLYDNLVKHIEGPEFNKRTRKRPLMLIQLKRHDQD